jgi:hypothetical protein
MDGSFMSTDHPPLNDVDLRQSLYCGNPFYHPSVMFRKEEMLKVGGYQGGETAEHCEDFNLWMRLADVGQFAAVPRVILRYRINPDSITAKYRHLQDSRIKAMVDHLWDLSTPSTTCRKDLRDTLQQYGKIKPRGYALALQMRVINDRMKLAKQFWQRGYLVAAIKQLLAIQFCGRIGFRYLLKMQRSWLRQLLRSREATSKTPWDRARARNQL